MRCPSCKKIMQENTSFVSYWSGDDWRERKGINFYCKNHSYQTEITIETNSELIKMLARSNNFIISKLVLLLTNYEYIENSVVVKNFRR
jgi:hypothetical protein